ncbi:MAG: hypothetical protein GY714_19985 [Desulfobacterales bacterium]|nr:hypothetical protein [Desulfobacterales bacterium]
MKHETTLEQQSNLPGAKSDFTRPLILELIDKDQGKEVLELLHSVGLELQEISRKPKFRIVKRGQK